MNDETKKTVEAFNRGGIVIFPTDTAFGIGCRIDNVEAIQRLYEIRRRPTQKACPVLVSGVEMAQNFLLPIENSVVERLMNPYWPGGLTIVLPCKIDKVPEFVRGGGLTLGVRMPSHQFLLEVIKQVGVPILAPSANFHGEETPFVFSSIDSNLLKNVDYIVQAKASGGNKASTVIDCSVSPWKILRYGQVEIDASIL